MGVPNKKRDLSAALTSKRGLAAALESKRGLAAALESKRGLAAPLESKRGLSAPLIGALLVGRRRKKFRSYSRLADDQQGGGGLGDEGEGEDRGDQGDGVDLGHFLLSRASGGWLRSMTLVLAPPPSSGV